MKSPPKDELMTNKQPNNIFQNITLEMILNYLLENYTWNELGSRINIKCFNENPSIKSSLKFLRTTPWARKKVEDLYASHKQKKQGRYAGKNTDAFICSKL